MAKLKGSVLFTGTLGDLTAYKRNDSDVVYIRRKGGPTKKQIKTKDSFANTRRNNVEFGGRAKASWWMRRMLGPLTVLQDYNFTPALNQLARIVQVRDTVSGWGKRGILFSKYPKLFEGFNLNKRSPLDSILRSPIGFTVSKQTLAATVKIPELMPGINFFVYGNYPLFSITTVLGILPDLAYSSRGYKPVYNSDQYPVIAEKDTGWQPVLKGMKSEEISLQLPAEMPAGSFSLVLSAGIRFGTVTDLSNGVEQVKRTGAAKIICVE
ncbi:MAG: hypothetical protein ABUT20_21745 [Bacteroidota bacterium]